MAKAKKEAVNESESVTETEEQKQTVETPDESVSQELEKEQQGEEENSDTSSVTDESSDLDEEGIPWKQRAKEWQRKATELSTALPDIVEKKLSEVFEKQNKNTDDGKPKWTISSLEAFALQYPEHRPWVEEEKEKIRAERLKSEILETVTKTEKAKEIESRKKASFFEVQKRFPNMFLKDANGNPLGWDNSNPMTMRVAQYMQDPELAQRGDALEVAARLAFADIALNQQKDNEFKKNLLKSKVKKLEKKTLTEGEGRNVSESSGKDSVREAISRLSQTGSKRDAESAVSAYLRKAGFIN